MWQYVAFIWHSLASFSTLPTAIICFISISHCRIFTANKSRKKHTAMDVSIRVIGWHIVVFLFIVISFSWSEVIDKLSHLNHTVSLLQYVALFVALLDVYSDTFLIIHHIVTHIIIRIFPKWLSSSDLVRFIVVCQTDAYPSAKLLLRTAEADSH